jgi:hypothetical protein
LRASNDRVGVTMPAHGGGGLRAQAHVPNAVPLLLPFTGYPAGVFSESDDR